jgi:hypothetical protein
MTYALWKRVYIIYPILHTVWLDSHELTLKNYTAKFYEVRKSDFLPTWPIFVFYPGKWYFCLYIFFIAIMKCYFQSIIQMHGKQATICHKYQKYLRA